MKNHLLEEEEGINEWLPSLICSVIKMLQIFNLTTDFMMFLRQFQVKQL